MTVVRLQLHRTGTRRLKHGFHGGASKGQAKQYSIRKKSLRRHLSIDFPARQSPSKGILRAFIQAFAHVMFAFTAPRDTSTCSSGVLVHGPVDMALDSVVPGGSNTRLSANQGYEQSAGRGKQRCAGFQEEEEEGDQNKRLLNRRVNEPKRHSCKQRSPQSPVPQGHSPSVVNFSIGELDELRSGRFVIHREANDNICNLQTHGNRFDSSAATSLQPTSTCSALELLITEVLASTEAFFGTCRKPQIEPRKGPSSMRRRLSGSDSLACRGPVVLFPAFQKTEQERR